MDDLTDKFGSIYLGPKTPYAPNYIAPASVKSNISINHINTNGNFSNSNKKTNAPYNNYNSQKRKKRRDFSNNNKPFNIHPRNERKFIQDFTNFSPHPNLYYSPDFSINTPADISLPIISYDNSFGPNSSSPYFYSGHGADYNCTYDDFLNHNIDINYNINNTYHPYMKNYAAEQSINPSKNLQATRLPIFSNELPMIIGNSVYPFELYQLYDLTNEYQPPHYLNHIHYSQMQNGPFPSNYMQQSNTYPNKTYSNHRRKQNDVTIMSAELQNRLSQRLTQLFMDEYLFQDVFMLKHTLRNKDGFVNLKLLSALRKIKKISGDWKDLAFVIGAKLCPLLMLNTEGTKVRRIRMPPLKTLVFSGSRLLFIYNVAINVDYMNSNAIDPLRFLLENFNLPQLELNKPIWIKFIRAGTNIPNDTFNFLHQFGYEPCVNMIVAEFIDTYSAHLVANALQKLLVNPSTLKSTTSIESKNDKFQSHLWAKVLPQILAANLKGYDGSPRRSSGYSSSTKSPIRSSISNTPEWIHNERDNSMFPIITSTKHLKHFHHEVETSVCNDSGIYTPSICYSGSDLNSIRVSKHLMVPRPHYNVTRDDGFQLSLSRIPIKREEDALGSFRDRAKTLNIGAFYNRKFNKINAHHKLGHKNIFHMLPNSVNEKCLANDCKNQNGNIDMVADSGIYCNNPQNSSSMLNKDHRNVWKVIDKSPYHTINTFNAYIGNNNLTTNLTRSTDTFVNRLFQNKNIPTKSFGSADMVDQEEDKIELALKPRWNYQRKSDPTTLT